MIRIQEFSRRGRDSKQQNVVGFGGNPAETIGGEELDTRKHSGRFPQIPAHHDARHAAELAGAYLRAAARGEPCEALAVALAEAVLTAAPTRLALAVLDGGRFAQARATELAELLLSASGHEDSVVGAGS